MLTDVFNGIFLNIEYLRDYQKMRLFRINSGCLNCSNDAKLTICRNTDEIY